jgi:hypothetical protein
MLKKKKKRDARHVLEEKDDERRVETHGSRRERGHPRNTMRYSSIAILVPTPCQFPAPVPMNRETDVVS